MATKNNRTRAEKLRDQRSNKRKNTSARPKRVRKSSTASVPPVLVRGDVPVFTMVKSKRRKKSRRRYDIALSVPGAEMRLPSLPAVRIGWRLISFMLTALLCLAIYTLWNSPTYQVSEVQIEGLERLTAREINSLVNLTGERIFTLNANQLQDEIKHTFPEFSMVDVTLDLPAEVHILVKERIPVLVWYQNGRTLWVDEAGVAFPAREDIEPPSLMINAAGDPQVNLTDDADPNQLLPEEFVSTALQIAELAPDEAKMIYSVSNGIGWKDKKGWEVYLGMDLNNTEMKLQVYEVIFKHLRKSNLKPSLVSVENVHAPYYRLEP